MSGVGVEEGQCTYWTKDVEDRDARQEEKRGRPLRRFVTTCENSA